MINNLEKKYLKAFGKNLQKVRKEHGYTQDLLGEEAGLGKNQIGMIERGEINTTISTIKKVADVLKIKPQELLDF